MLQELRAAGVDANDVAVIMALRSHIGYHPCKTDAEARITSRRGEWGADRPLLGARVRECSTLFADDLRIHYEFNSKSELDKFLPNLTKCLAILKSIGLQVQRSKTQVIMAGRGRQFKIWRKKHTRKTNDGPRLVLWSEKGQSQQLPIVTSATYLGIKVSYQNFEKLTLQHRLAAANAQRARLLKVLHHKGISVKRRLQLWVTCVRSAALYGLHAVEMGKKQVDRPTIALTKHVWAIVGSFAHMRKESSRDLYSRYATADPLDLYRHRSQKVMENARASQDPMVNNVGTLAWMIKLCVQGGSLTSHLSNHPCTNLRWKG